MTAVPYSLRDSTEADRQLLFEVYAHTRAAELAAAPWTTEQKHAFVVHQFLAQDADYRARWPHGRFLVVEAGGEPVGRLYLGETAEEVRVIDVALLPRHCGRGIGTAIMRDVLADAARRGLAVVLHVEHWNPARRLYERLGFTEAGRGDVHVRMEWRAS